MSMVLVGEEVFTSREARGFEGEGVGVDIVIGGGFGNLEFV